MHSKNTITMFLTIALSLIAITGAYANQTERILRYHSDIFIHGDGSMTVTETIRVIATGDNIKRGIFRTFPTTYRDRYGNRIKVGFDITQVLRNNQPEPYLPLAQKLLLQ